MRTAENSSSQKDLFLNNPENHEYSNFNLREVKKCQFFQWMHISLLIYLLSDYAIIAKSFLYPKDIRKDFLYTAIVVLYKNRANHRVQVPMM